MEKPTITQAPLGWLQAVVEDCPDEADDHVVEGTIGEVKDGSLHTFTFLLGEIRDELRKRTTN